MVLVLILKIKYFIGIYIFFQQYLVQGPFQFVTLNRAVAKRGISKLLMVEIEMYEIVSI